MKFPLDLSCDYVNIAKSINGRKLMNASESAHFKVLINGSIAHRESNHIFQKDLAFLIWINYKQQLITIIKM